MRKTAGTFLILLGFISIITSIFLLWQRYNPNRLKFDIEDINSNVDDIGSISQPTAVVISDLSIALPIFATKVDKGKWQAIGNGVSYLSTTPVPGEMGNSVLYGHNWKSLLGNLTKAKPGNNIDIYYSNGSKKTFTITYTQEVSPDQTKILDQTSDRRITIYTCSGFLDSRRFVVTAILSADRDVLSSF